MDANRGGPSQQLSLTRKQLYDMVWSTPMLRLARTFQCSSTWLARICREASVPVPPRGYWAKKRAGKAARRQGLPRSADPDELVVSYTPSTEPEEPAAKPPPPAPPPPPPLDEDLRSLKAQIEQTGPIAVPTEIESLLPIVSRTRSALRRTDPRHQTKHGLLKHRWSTDGCLIELEVSARSMDRALRLFDALFRALMQLGGRIVTADRSPVVKLLGDKVEFSLRERPKMHRLAPEEQKSTWDKIRWDGSGVFYLSLSVDPELGFRCHWHDGRKGLLEQRVQQILLDTVERIQDGRRWRLGAPERELERQRQQQEERQRQVEKFRIEAEERTENDRVAFLHELAAQHAKAMQLRAMLDACKTLPNHTCADDRWIAWAERVLAGIDPVAWGLAGIRTARRPYGQPLFAKFADGATGGL